LFLEEFPRPLLASMAGNSTAATESSERLRNSIKPKWVRFPQSHHFKCMCAYVISSEI